MNIFEALSQGKGSINEENTSSFLAYLLKSNESHGLQTEFLERFLKVANIDLDNLFGYGTDIRDCYVNIELEKELKNNNKKYSRRRFIDILIQIKNEDNKTLNIGIENKINDSSSQQKQLQEEYEALESMSKDNFCIVFLAPDGIAAKREYDTACKKTDAINKKRLCFVLWDDIIGTIEEMLRQEQKIEIAPMSDYLKHTLRAFCYYIRHRNDIKVKNSIKVHYNKYGEDFELIQLSNGAMRINCDNRENLIPKLMIFDVLFSLYPKEKKLLKKTSATNIFQGTPAALGNKIFQLLKEQNKKTVVIDDENPQFGRDKTLSGHNVF